jgi:hypothetical protein
MEIEVFEMITRLNKMNDKLTELVTRSEYESESPTQKLAREYINSDVAARLLHISPRSLAKMRQKGSVPFTKVGRKIVYNTSDLKSYLEENRRRLKS